MGCDDSLHRSFLLTKLTCYNSQLTTEHIQDFTVVCWGLWVQINVHRCELYTLYLDTAFTTAGTVMLWVPILASTTCFQCLLKLYYTLHCRPTCIRAPLWSQCQPKFYKFGTNRSSCNSLDKSVGQNNPLVIIFTPSRGNVVCFHQHSSFREAKKYAWRKWEWSQTWRPFPSLL